MLLVSFYAWGQGNYITLVFDSRSRTVAVSWKNKNTEKALKVWNAEIHNSDLLKWFLVHSSICCLANDLSVGMDPASVSTIHLNSYRTLKLHNKLYRWDFWGEKKKKNKPRPRQKRPIKLKNTISRDAKLFYLN